jgi:hypothetical protein
MLNINDLIRDIKLNVSVVEGHPEEDSDFVLGGLTFACALVSMLAFRIKQEHPNFSMENFANACGLPLVAERIAEDREFNQEMNLLTVMHQLKAEVEKGQ